MDSREQPRLKGMKAVKLRKQLLKEVQGKASSKEVKRLKKEINKIEKK